MMIIIMMTTTMTVMAGESVSWMTCLQFGNLNGVPGILSLRITTTSSSSSSRDLRSSQHQAGMVHVHHFHSHPRGNRGSLVHRRNHHHHHQGAVGNVSSVELSSNQAKKQSIHHYYSTSPSLFGLVLHRETLAVVRRYQMRFLFFF